MPPHFAATFDRGLHLEGCSVIKPGDTLVYFQFQKGNFNKKIKKVTTAIEVKNEKVKVQWPELSRPSWLLLENCEKLES
jgi:hypothetical protein